MPVPRTEVAGVAWRGGIATAGGFVAGGAASDAAHFFSPQRDRWAELPSLPSGRHHSTLAVLGERLYAVGGYDGQSAPSASVWSLGEGESSWRDEPPMPVGRGAHVLVALNGRLIAAGGVVNGAATNSVAVFENGKWHDAPAMQKAREHLAAAVGGGRVYVIAGRVGGTNFTDVESWDGVGPWRDEPPVNDSRGGMAADAIGDQPCVAGGEEAAGTIASVECLRDGKWERVAELRRPRHGLVVVALGSELHVIGGGRRPGLTVSGIHEVLSL